jgi:hypothetical protein
LRARLKIRLDFLTKWRYIMKSNDDTVIAIILAAVGLAFLFLLISDDQDEPVSA